MSKPPPVQVRVEGPPVFPGQEDQQVFLPCGEKVLLRCEAGGRPPPETVWQRQTDLGDLAPPVLSENIRLEGNGSLLVVRHDGTSNLQSETMFVCLASNRKGSIERSVTVTSEDNCQEEEEVDKVVEEEEEEEREVLEHTVTEKGSLTLNCSVPPGPVLVQWEAVRGEGGRRRYMTSWLAGLEQEYGRGCGEEFGIHTGGFHNLGCKVGVENIELRAPFRVWKPQRGARNAHSWVP